MSPLTFTEFNSYKLPTEFTDNGQCVVHTYPDPSGPRIEQWSRVRRIGDGGFGTVWKEECAQTGQVRAVKQMKRWHIKTTGEMLALIKMSPYSQYFVQFFGWFLDEEHLYLAMEYLHCGDLEGLIEEERDMPEGEVKSVSTQLVEGLAIMHEHSFCHRDLKPQNILIVKWVPIHVKIADFGISKQTSDKTELKTFAGTTDYLAPEILNLLECETSYKYTNAVDIWSLGCLVYKMITRVTPFPGSKGLLKYVQRKAPFPESKLSEKRSTAIGFIKSLMMPEPQERLTAEDAKTHPWLKQDLSPTWQEFPDILMPSNMGAPLTQEDIDKRAQNEQVLIMAAANGHLDIVELSLEKGVDVDAATPSGTTGLHKAAQNGHLEIAKLLIEEGANVLAVENSGGYTPLHWAAQESHLEIVKLLLENGAEVEALNMNECTPFHCSVENGQREIMELLLGEGSDVSRLTKSGESALITTVKKDQLKIARFLLEKGADVLWKDNTTSETALHLAAKNQSWEMVKLLLLPEYRADITAKDAEGLTALHWAVKGGSPELVEVLLENGANISESTADENTPLILASRAGHKEIVELLLKSGADVMAKDGGGLLALHWAARGGSVGVVKLLADNGPQALKKVDNNQATVLHHAAYSGDFYTVQFILKQRGTDLTARNYIGETALHIAVETRSDPIEIVNLLMARGLKMTTRDKHELTVLHRAVDGAHLEVVRLLLNRGASVSAIAVDGSTPLIRASGAAVSCVEMLQLLLDNGADIMEKDNLGDTALHLVATYDDVLQVAKFLLKNGADIRATNNIGETPLTKAIREKNLLMVQFLLDNGGEDLANVDGVETALHTAARFGSKETFLLLLRKGAKIDAKNSEGQTPLDLATREGNREIVSLIFDWDPDEIFNWESENASSPQVGTKTLIAAAADGDLDALKLLMDQGADISAKDDEGFTALHRAAGHGFRDATRLLLEKSANPGERSAQGFTPLHLSVSFGHIETTKLLLDGGANPNARSVTNMTPILMAVHHGDVSIAEYLISRGADIRARSLSDMLSINLAAQNGNLEMFELILRSGANPTWKGTHGYTALHEAAKYGHPEIVQRLLEFEEVDVEAKNDDQVTPLVLAAEYGHEQVLRLLANGAKRRNVDPVKLNVSAVEGVARASSNEHWEAVKFLDSILSEYHGHGQFAPPPVNASTVGDIALAEEPPPAEGPNEEKDEPAPEHPTMKRDLVQGNQPGISIGGDSRCLVS